MRPATVVPVLSVLVSLGLAVALWRTTDALDRQTNAAHTADIARLQAENEVSTVSARLLNESKARLAAEDQIAGISEKLDRSEQGHDKATARRLAAEELARVTGEKLARAEQGHDKATARRLAAEEEARLANAQLASETQARLAAEAEVRTIGQKLAEETKARETAEEQARVAEEKRIQQSQAPAASAPVAAARDAAIITVWDNGRRTAVSARPAVFPAALRIGTNVAAAEGDGGRAAGARR
jgi:hypothetical protein